MYCYQHDFKMSEICKSTLTKQPEDIQIAYQLRSFFLRSFIHSFTYLLEKVGYHLCKYTASTINITQTKRQFQIAGEKHG